MLAEPLVQDGAPWIVEAVVVDSSEREQAYVHVVGWSCFSLIEVRGSEDGADLDAIEAALVDGLTAEPRGLAPCRIVVHDPETDVSEVFGWDGDLLLGRRRD